ncbi:NAD(P)-dependent methylenetetrahydromethanopterin dehydrogenase [Sphaerotilus microaerophilus]|uniref:Methylenetetrahydromethanopterin dehydrogenase n=1 Tax=Sphaerotilus microaerophilus TaxID=2914710 RepID=A0ABN6PRU5_9BURK|nr:NAD(P)-dependent methylenetetrahydromethanopterin dehydrogenase [Sphaerotilus sp. FB-5]BDI06595.1 methylenetetrahydromethanopterin dehydrogenase [Sphaerotilus sp. FB-5]
MERPYILHLFTPGSQMSPFDVNMAADAGYQVIAPYTGVTLEGVAALTQDAIFSRSPKGLARTAIFIGGRDALLAADMLEKAKRAMFAPFQVALMADPSGAYTTAAAMVACVEAALREHAGSTLAGRRVVVLGGTGPVGRIACVLAAQAGAQVALSSRTGIDAAEAAARLTGERFGVTLEGVSGGDRAAVRASLETADVLLSCAAAGVQAVGAEDLAFARNLRVAADVNAVPPAGVAGVEVMDRGAPIAGLNGAVGIGALAIGNVKYQTQQQLLRRMHEAGTPQVLSFREAFELARQILAAPAAA